MTEMVDFRTLGRTDVDAFDRVAAGVFDHAIDREGALEFLTDPHLHIAVAVRRGEIIGFASGVDYLNPDKPREMWINEVGVAPGHRGSGIGQGVVRHLLEEAKRVGCVEAWVLTDADNDEANALYQSVGGEEERPGQRMYVFGLSGS